MSFIRSSRPSYGIYTHSILKSLLNHNFDQYNSIKSLNLMPFPFMNAAVKPLHLAFSTQQRTNFLLQIVSSISLIFLLSHPHTKNNLNPLSANPTKRSNTLKQFVHLMLKGLKRFAVGICLMIV